MNMIYVYNVYTGIVARAGAAIAVLAATMPVAVVTARFGSRFRSTATVSASHVHGAVQLYTQQSTNTLQ